MKVKKSGLIAIVGRPNAGKSTLLNRLAGEKLAIVSDKPQTTRHRISAIVSQGDTQFVFFDTPGFHKPHDRLGEVMVNTVYRSAEGVDAALLVVEPVARIGKPEALLIARLAQTKAPVQASVSMPVPMSVPVQTPVPVPVPVPVVLAINKIDTVPKGNLLAVIETYRVAYGFAAIVPISAKDGDGTGLLLDELAPFMPEGPALYPEGQVTDQPERMLIAELVREKLLGALDKEVPHGVAVEVETLREREDGLVEIGVVILCEKDSHKGIIIGKNGAMLKKIGAQARADLEEMYEGPVLLKSWARVKEGWRNKPGQLREMGFDL
ncbi:MAG: GTPase Era [Oscillospiraceae bacterium]|nr:GTPase Era [Oscillospiraceae bacterium]